METRCLEERKESGVGEHPFLHILSTYVHSGDAVMVNIDCVSRQDPESPRRQALGTCVRDLLDQVE